MTAIKQLKKGDRIDPNWIEWGAADENSHYEAGDLIWTFEPEYPIANIAPRAFLDKYQNYLDDEIRELLADFALTPSATFQEVLDNTEVRVAGWIQFDEEIGQGMPFKEELHIAEIPCDDEPFRHCIFDGWHRFGAALKHHRKTVPAFVGRLPK